MTRCGLYFSRVIGTKREPKEPVPPVMRMVDPVNIIMPSFLSAAVCVGCCAKTESMQEIKSQVGVAEL